MWTYVVLFIVADTAGVGILQWGVTISNSDARVPGLFQGLWALIAAMWLTNRYVFALNFLVLGSLYLTLIFLINRFWIATPIFLVFCTVLGVIEQFKVLSRYEAVLPADFGFLGSDAGNIATFLPAGAGQTIVLVIVSIVVLIALNAFLQHMDARRGRIVTARRISRGASARIVGVLVPALFLGLFIQTVGTVGAWGNSFAAAMGDIPSMWDSVYDAQRNGTLISFARQLNPKVMDEPADYNEATMQAIVKRYEQSAKTINASRKNDMNGSTVVYILSESFSDSTRVPGLSLNEDPMPQIRAIKSSTTSGLMLSSGYGGGTANLEFQALTGLSMANFDASLTSPYQQLVPSLSWTPTINQAWGASRNQIALHPYESSMYSRSTDYKKFGFSHFWTLNEPEVIQYRNRIDQSPYVSDESAYNSALNKIQADSDGHQFVQLVTMQNHMPFNNWYNNNQFVATAASGSKALGKSETMSIETYAKGMSYTDSATQSFLDSLDAMNKPITVMFYGDHLPGVYTTAGAHGDNSIALHETDYFIWSNSASSTHDNKIADSSYSSPNFFMAQMADHMNAKVSPYIAFLTKLHTKIAAMEPPVVNKIQGWTRIPAGQTIYLDSNGNPMNANDFDGATKQLVHDYKLIQYDITAGSHYLQRTDFLSVPSSKTVAQSSPSSNLMTKAASDVQHNTDSTEQLVQTVAAKNGQTSEIGMRMVAVSGR